jgi:multidrug efflux system membrane fusion protein
MKKLVLIIILGAAGYAAWYFRPEPQTPAASGRGSGGKPGDLPPVPVVAGKVEKKDIPIYIGGLGNVVGYNTVTVRTRVDGQLDKVAFTEGQDVHVGDLLAQIDPRPFKAALEQAVAKKNQDEAQLANAKLDVDRYSTLLEQKAVTTQKVDTQKALVAQLDATVKADDAAIESARVQLDYTTINSPIDGRAGIRLVDQGNVVHAADGTGLVVITQLHPIYVVFTLPEQNLQAIQREMSKGPLSVIALGRDNNTELGKGSLSVVDNQIDMTTGTIKLKATFPNDDLQLWPGQFVNVRLLVTTKKDGIVVPGSVVQRGPDSTFAFVIKEDDSVEIRPIKVAQFEDGKALIEEGLSVGERVVVDGQYRLQPGSRVKLGGAKPGAGKPEGKGKLEGDSKPASAGKPDETSSAPGGGKGKP